MTHLQSLLRNERPSTIVLGSLVGLAYLLSIWIAQGWAKGGDLHGGIEIGGTGVKATALELFIEPDGIQIIALPAIKPINTGIATGLKEKGIFAPEAIQDTAQAVKQLYTHLTDDLKISSDNIYIVGSSGVSGAKNTQELAAKVKEMVSKDMEFLTPEKEVELTIAGLIPKRYARSSMLMDIGGSNTKGGYQEGSTAADLRLVTVSFPYGLRTTGADDSTKVASLLGAETERKSGLRNRKRVYMSGGVVWIMATLLHPENRRAYVRISAEDIDVFYKRVVETLQTGKDADFFKVNLANIQTPAKKKIVGDDLEQMRGIYTLPQLKVGAELLQALATSLQLKGKQIYFTRNGVYAWLLAYVTRKLPLPPEQEAETEEQPPSRDHVLWAQLNLKCAGFDPGPRDGMMGPKVQEALGLFQTKQGLIITEELDHPTHKALGLPDKCQ